MAHETHVAELVLGISMLLLLASGTLALAQRWRLPFTILLVIVGMVLHQGTQFLPSAMARLLDINISPDVILYVFLPSLIFESAFHLDARQLRDNLLPVLTLAVPGLLMSTALIGLLVSTFTDVPLAAALVLGAILSATDPVAVIALFHQLGAPQRLTVLVEGESLFNDATAIVAAKILLAVAIAGYVTPSVAGGAVLEFVVVFGGGIVVGWLMALAAGFVLGVVHENQAIEISILTTLAYLSFLVGEEVFHVSGVMATVAAGITIGGWGRSKLSPGIADYIEHFWAYVAFVANALIFLLVGIAIDFAALAAFFDVLVVAILAMLLSRAVVVYGLVPVVGRLPGSDAISRAYQTVMYWGGLRGAVALAVVLSLGDFEWTRAFTAVVMGAVLFTLVIQGLSIEPLMRRLGLDEPPAADRIARDEARVEANLRALDRIPELGAGGLFSAAIAGRLAKQQEQTIAALRRSVAEIRQRELGEAEASTMLRLRCLATERTAYYELYGRHHIDESVYRALDHDVARRLEALRHGRRAQDAGMLDATVGRTRLPALMPRSIADWLHTRRVARDYLQIWAVFQAAERVDAYLAEQQQLGTADAALLGMVRTDYAARQSRARAQLDDWAAQFPEFVKSMQERLGGRLLLLVERDFVAGQVHSGQISHSLGGDVLESIDQRLRELAAPSFSELEVEPVELLAKVPFFAGLEEADLAQVAGHFKSVTVAPGEDIIRAGETGTSMYFIARGVVRVLRDEAGDEAELATLFAGDFFGEMALLDDTLRSATCRAATACAVHELDRAGVVAATAVCPALAESLRAAADARAPNAA